MKMLKIFALALATSAIICGAAKSESPYGPCPTPNELAALNGQGFVAQRIKPIFVACIEKGKFKVRRFNGDEPEYFAVVKTCNDVAEEFIHSCSLK